MLASGIVARQAWLASELSSRVYRIGFGDDPPFQFRAANGAPTGVAIEIVKEAARRRGIHLEWVQPAHFSSAAIENGEADIWVLMTDLPERRRDLYLSDPYLTMERCFLVLRSSGLRSARDLEHARIAYRQSWAGAPSSKDASLAGSNADALYLDAHFPSATRVPLSIDRAGGLVEALERHQADAGLVNKAVIAAQLASEEQRQALDLINAPDAIGPLGLGASFAARRAAESLRSEIDRMAEDGGMSRVTEPWGFFQTASLNIIGQLAEARRTNRMLGEGLAGAVAALALIGILSVLVRRQRNAVRDLTSRLISAQEQERTRIARDLHDDINQQVATLALSLGRLKRSAAAPGELGPEPWQSLLAQVERLRSGVHRISHALHPALLELSGLLSALEALRRDVATASGVEVSLEPGPLAGPDAEIVPPEVALCFYRVAQEALQNAVKHSESKEVRIRVARIGKAMELSVSDSGKGISDRTLASATGLGLVSMRERARLIHGHARIDSCTEDPRRGTTVTVSVSLAHVSVGADGARTDHDPEAAPRYHGKKRAPAEAKS